LKHAHGTVSNLGWAWLDDAINSGAARAEATGANA